MTGGLVPSSREFFRFFGLDAEKLAWAKPGRHRHASRPDEPRRRDRQRHRRRPGAQRHRRAGGDGRRRAAWRCSTCWPGTFAAMRDILFVGARLLDPATGLDAPGDLLVRDGLIADDRHRPRPPRGRPDARRRRRSASPPAWSTCAPPSASRAPSTARPSPPPPRAAVGRRHHHPLRPARHRSGAGRPGPGAVRAPPRRGDRLPHPAALRRRHQRLRGPRAGRIRPAAGSRRHRLHRRPRAPSATPGPCASRSPTPAPSAASIVQHPEEPSPRRRRRRDRGRAGDPARPARHPGRGRGDAGRRATSPWPG